MFNYDSKGQDPTGAREAPPDVLPENKYRLRIARTKDLKSKDGDDMVVVELRVDKGELKGARVGPHFVVFPDPEEASWAGIALHFLKCIGEPWEGNFRVDSKRWIGRLIEADVIEDVYKGKAVNKLENIYEVPDQKKQPEPEEPGPEMPPSKAPTEDLEEIPF